MCYGMNCLFEDGMGECTVISKLTKCRELTGYDACFIGGAYQDEEEKEEYNRLAESGRIDELLEVVSNIGKRHPSPYTAEDNDYQGREE